MATPGHWVRAPRCAPRARGGLAEHGLLAHAVAEVAADEDHRLLASPLDLLQVGLDHGGRARGMQAATCSAAAPSRRLVALRVTEPAPTAGLTRTGDRRMLAGSPGSSQRVSMTGNTRSLEVGQVVLVGVPRQPRRVREARDQAATRGRPRAVPCSPTCCAPPHEVEVAPGDAGSSQTAMVASMPAWSRAVSASASSGSVKPSPAAVASATRGGPAPRSGDEEERRLVGEVDERCGDDPKTTVTATHRPMARAASAGTGTLAVSSAADSAAVSSSTASASTMSSLGSSTCTSPGRCRAGARR